MHELLSAKTPTILILLGATGDLTAKKIVPALWNLYQKDKLPKKFRVVGFSRRELADDKFAKRVASILQKNKNIKTSRKKIGAFIKLFSYHSGLFERQTDYKKLAIKLQAFDRTWGVCTNKLFYLAVPPKYYESIFQNLASTGLTKPCSDITGWTRLIVEKPFGKDLKTAQELDALLGKLFKEEQIYPIDHYLGKEMLENILTFRFANNLFERNWHKKMIDRIEIRVLEKFGVDNRGSFYDGVGALRDVGQNHLLQMLALVTMENPVAMSARTVRTHRAEILRTLKIPTQKDIIANTYRAQYSGYRNTTGVRSNSDTETYFKIRASLESPRWEGVPIILEHGKGLAEQKKEIVIYFKHPQPCFCLPNQHLRNKVTFSIEPEEKISICFWAKKPGFTTEIEERTFTFDLHSQTKSSEHLQEYEKLLHSCIVGDQTLFVSTNEVKSMWKFIDPIVSGWKRNVVPLKKYKRGSNQPREESHKIEELTNQTAELKREIGIIGLGKMGAGIARQLMRKGWRVVGYNRSPGPTKELEIEGMVGAYSLDELVQKLGSKKVIWIMVPAGRPVNQTLFHKDGLINLLKRGDTIIDGGNSYYQDSIKRSKLVIKKGLHYMDVGVSGGPKGARYGASLMIGGQKKDFKRLEKLFSDMSVENGYAFFPGYGAGHFVKMVHNGIEYGMMQAIAEGFSIMKKSNYNLDLKKITKVYNHGSVIESMLVEWLYDAYNSLGVELKGVSGSVAHTGEGAWTVAAAKSMKVPAKIIAGALNFRKLSAKNPSYAGQVLSALRGQFGGHDIKSTKKIKR
ncbi:glucose-6-phosphate dehydrogenase [Patescibacteria group bacterium]|nr:glucose-6-phosphate dehydrogenase [Patescibacteria group bacterium]